MRVSVVAAALLAGLGASAATAGAAPGEASFALRPVTYDPALNATRSYFVLATRPGALIRRQVRVANTGGSTGTAYLYPVDATTGQTSGAVYLARRSPRRDVGAWIRLARSQVTLPPGASTVVGFTVRVPRTIRPGDHLGGIVAENATLTPSTGAGALQIRIRHLTIDAVELQLPGRVVARADVTGVEPGGEHGYQYVYLHLRNTGTILIKPAGSVSIADARGAVVSRRSFQLDTFVPGTAIDYPVLLPRLALRPGTYSATVRLHSSGRLVPGYRVGQGAPFGVSRTFSFVVSPAQQSKVYSAVAPLAAPSTKETQTPGRQDTGRSLIGPAVSVLALLLAIGLAVWGFRRRRARRGDGPVDEEGAVQPGDDAPRTLSELLLPYAEAAPRNGAAVAERTSEPEPEPAVRPAPTPEEIEALIRRHDAARRRDADDAQERGPRATTAGVAAS